MNDIQVEEFQMLADPTFDDGTTHVGHITFVNPKGQAITYGATLYLAAPANLTVPITSSPVKTFSIAAGGTSSRIDFTVMAPLLAVSTATFVACCAITVAGVTVVTFVGATAVVVNFSPSINWGDITWD